MKKSRTQNAIFNSSISMIIQVLKIIVSFVNRSFFIYFLGIVYLGLNGLFTSILSMLSLAELGMTTAIAVSLYKPLAENNYSKVNSYMNLFKNIYIKISGIVGVLGLIISFFLPYLIKDIDITAEIYIIYYLFLINTATSYLFTYKRTLLEADQKRYIIVTIDFLVFLIGSILQWLFLITTGNFIVYLFIMILMTISSNILISRKIERIYNYISDKEVNEVTKIEKRNFYRNVKGTIISKIAETIVFSTDNILMSAFISVNTVGLYANYSMIVSNIQSIVSQLISSLSGSLGNLIHTENSSEKATIILKKYQFIVFILIFFIMFYLYNLPLEALIYTGSFCFLAALVASFSDFVNYRESYKKLKFLEKIFCIYTNIFSHIRKFSPLRTSGNIPSQGALSECVIVGIFLPIRSRFFTPIFKALWAAFYPQMRAAKWLPHGEDFPRRAVPRPWERSQRRR